MAQTYDVIIIGGGIMGCASAYELTRRGVSVALIEKQTIGEGPTGHSSAVLRTHYSNELTARMAQYGLAVYGDFAERFGDGCGFHRTGFVMLLAEDDLAGARHNVELLRGLGVETDIIDADALADVLPQVEEAGLAAGIWEPHSGHADAYLAVTGYARAAKRLGVEILEETEVTGIRLERDEVVGVESTAGALDAPKVLNAGGAWGARIARMIGVDVPIDACRVQVAFYRRSAESPASHPVVADFPNQCYFRPDVGRLTLGGLIDPSEAEAVVDPDRFSKSVDYAFQADVGARLSRRLTYFENAGVEKGYASLYAITPDWHPIVDELVPGSGCYICAGFSGHGFKLGPAVGVMVADLLTAEQEPRFDPEPFRMSRYRDDALLRGEYGVSIVG